MKNFKKIWGKLKNFSRVEILRLILSPLTNLIVGPINFCIFLVRLTVLTKHKGDQFSRFSGIPSLNCFFYWTQALNIQKYGKNGVSPNLQSGEFKINSLFHLTHTSLYLFWKHGNIVVLMSFVFFSLTPLYFLYGKDELILKFLPFIILFSPIIYSAIDRMNYGSLGWAIFPLFIYLINTGLYFLAAIVLLLSLQLCFTAVVFGAIIFFINIVAKDNYTAIIYIIPVIMAVANRLRLSAGGFNEIVLLIGADAGKALYSRKKEFNLISFYYCILFSAFLLLSFIDGNGLSITYYCGLLFCIFFMLNEANIVRIADPHSFLITLLAILMNEAHFSYSLWSTFGVVMFSYPIPYAGLFLGDPKVIDILPVRKPVYVTDIMDKQFEFLENIPSGEKILFCYNNPNGEYQKIFDGYRQVYEVLIYCANIRDILVTPDWYYIAANNTIKATEVWGRDYQTALENAKKINAKYIICYEHETAPLDMEFENSDQINVKATLDWKNLLSSLYPSPPFGTASTPHAPKWHIYEIKTNVT